jgi:hypothetical protein
MSMNERLDAFQITVDETPAKWKVLDNLDPAVTLQATEGHQINLFISSETGSIHRLETMNLMWKVLGLALNYSLDRVRTRSTYSRHRVLLPKKAVKQWLCVDPVSFEIVPYRAHEITEMQVIDILREVNRRAVLVHLDVPKNLIKGLLQDLDPPLMADNRHEESYWRAYWEPEQRALKRSQRVHPPRPSLPIESDKSARRRMSLMADDWYTSSEVGDLLGSAAESNPNQYAASLRKTRKLLGVWVVSENGYRHPPCQFSGRGVLPQMADLLKLLPGPSGSGWEQAEWLYSPHALLNGRKPAEVLSTDPDRVVSAARREYGEDKDAGW